MAPKLKELLKGKLNEGELGEVISSFDVVGELAIIKIPKKLIKKQLLIATAIFQLQPSVKTILKITQEHSGKFRLPKYKFLAGKKTFETISKENGCSFHVDVRKSYFSPRLSNERKRIYEQVEEGETVCVFFAGVGAFAIEIAKYSNAKNVIGIEWNPSAVRSMEKNMQLNKIKNMQATSGNVAVVSKKFFNSCSRVVMPSPSNSEKYLDYALKCLKNKKGIIHFYHFAENKDSFKKPVQWIESAAKKQKLRLVILHSRVVNAVSSQKVQVCIDARIG